MIRIDRLLGLGGARARNGSAPAGHGANGSADPDATVYGVVATNVSAGAPPATSTPAGASPPPPDRALLAKRDRLVERFTAMQLDLGGAFYEMTIRDHVRADVLTRKAAELQRVDAELRQVEQILKSGDSSAGKCPACNALYAPGAAFCWQCGTSLLATSKTDPGQ